VTARLCPRCQTEVSAGLPSCPQCGQQMYRHPADSVAYRAARPGRAGMDASSAESYTFCPGCGRELVIGQPECPGCRRTYIWDGPRLRPAPAPPRAPQPTPPPGPLVQEPGFCHYCEGPLAAGAWRCPRCGEGVLVAPIYPSGERRWPVTLLAVRCGLMFGADLFIFLQSWSVPFDLMLRCLAPGLAVLALGAAIGLWQMKEWGWTAALIVFAVDFLISLVLPGQAGLTPASVGAMLVDGIGIGYLLLVRGEVTFD